MRDPISGTWTTGANYMVLRYDGKGVLSGMVTAGHPGNPAQIKSGTFDAATNEMVIAGDARSPRNGETVTYEIRGRLAEGRLAVDYRFGHDTGSGTLIKVTPMVVLQTIVSSIGKAVGRLFSHARAAAQSQPPMTPEAWAATRRTKHQNEEAMRARGETLESFMFREPQEADIDALAMLHVITWSATYPDVLSPPTFAIRSWQWRDAFAKPFRNWFCFVIENSKGQLVGFTKGVRMSDTEGDLNKIYLLDEYQRMGLGRCMLGRVTRRFMSMGVTTMYVNAEADNPSCRFYEAMGGVNTIDEKTGRPNYGNYVWRDLPALSAQCPE